MPRRLPVAAVDIIVDGAKLDNKYVSQLLDVQVRDNLLLPDTAVVRLRDPDGEFIDRNPLAPGANLQVNLGARNDTATETVFDGMIVALEPEFGERDCVIAVRAYDHGFKLNGNRKSLTFQNQKAEDMVRQVAGAAGLVAGTVHATGVVHPFFQQSMETDWEFCTRLAAMNNFEFSVAGKTFHFRRRERGTAAARLTWGENLLTFRPRMSGIGQPKDVTVANHDPKTRQDLKARATRPALTPSSTAADGRAALVGKLTGGSVVVADRVVTTGTEAEKTAQAVLDRIASSFVEAEGKASGSPKLRAGATIRAEKVGPFSGEYVLSQTTHRFGGGDDYTTSFVISGRTGHGISDLLRRGGAHDWASSLVIGVVTNNNDPDKMGRVRVKYPALGDAMEGWWARVSTLNAGRERGVYMLPQVGDEVVVAFEHGDPRRPLVIGSLYNGKDKPPADLHDAQGRKAAFGVKSDHKVHVESKEAMTLRSGQTMTLEAKADYLLDGKANVEEKAAQSIKTTAGQSIEIAANQSVTIKGAGSVTVESQGTLKLKGAIVDIEGTGPVNIKGAIVNLG